MLKAERVMADGAQVGTEFQSRIADGNKYECRYMSVLKWGDLELVFVPPGAAVSGHEETCSGVYVSIA